MLLRCCPEHDLPLIFIYHFRIWSCSLGWFWNILIDIIRSYSVLTIYIWPITYKYLIKNTSCRRSHLHMTRLSPNIISEIFFFFRSSFSSWYLAFNLSRPIWSSEPRAGQTSRNWLTLTTNCLDRQNTEGRRSFQTFTTERFNWQVISLHKSCHP